MHLRPSASVLALSRDDDVSVSLLSEVCLLSTVRLLDSGNMGVRWFISSLVVLRSQEGLCTVLAWFREDDVFVFTFPTLVCFLPFACWSQASWE